MSQTSGDMSVAYSHSGTPPLLVAFLAVSIVGCSFLLMIKTLCTSSALTEQEQQQILDSRRKYVLERMIITKYGIESDIESVVEFENSNTRKEKEKHTIGDSNHKEGSVTDTITMTAQDPAAATESRMALIAKKLERLRSLRRLRSERRAIPTMTATPQPPLPTITITTTTATSQERDHPKESDEASSSTTSSVVTKLETPLPLNGCCKLEISDSCTISDGSHLCPIENNDTIKPIIMTEVEESRTPIQPIEDEEKVGNSTTEYEDNDSSTTSSTEICSVCLGNFSLGDEICQSRNPTCCHKFHLECLVQWLMNHDDCPLCRKYFLGADDDASSDYRRQTEQFQEALYRFFGE